MEKAPVVRAAPSPLYHHAELNAFECIGCREMIEVPRLAVVGTGHKRRVERIAGQPENLLLWLEVHELDHSKCHLYGDAESARNARQFRKEQARRALTGENEAPRKLGRSGDASARPEDETESFEPPLDGVLRG